MNQASSPGKLILAGEHAVLAGCPALALATTPLVQCRTRTSDSDTVTLMLPGAQPITRNREDLLSLSREVKDRHAQARAPRCPEDLLFTAIHQFLPEWTGTIEFFSDLPVGSGMGASAAFLLSLGKALRPDMTNEQLYGTALDLEHLQHGTSSGLDVWTSLHGGCWWVQGEKRTRLDLREFPGFRLYHTGIPEASTGECVRQVQKTFPQDHPVWSEFDEVIRRTRRALEASDAHGWNYAIRTNQKLLWRIGVVPEAVHQQIQRIEQAGGAAKVCGAGSTSGNRAGAVLVRDADPEVIPKDWSDIDASFCKVGTSQ